MTNNQFDNIEPKPPEKPQEYAFLNNIIDDIVHNAVPTSPLIAALIKFVIRLVSYSALGDTLYNNIFKHF